MNTDELNQKFGIKDILLFQEENDMQMAVISNDHSSAIISLYGGQVLSFKPHGSEDLLFVSSQAEFRVGKAIRGGIPVCFPWFNAHPTNKELPNHGFARISKWDIEKTEQLLTGETRLIISLSSSEATKKLWKYNFKVEFEIIIGKSLLVKWQTENLDEAEFTFSQALHSYFNVGDINSLTIAGLENQNYMETIILEEPFEGEKSPIKISRQTDRDYLNSDTTCEIIDINFNRKIKISKKGSLSTVVWNPWKELSVKMSDLGDDDYLSFVCVESANTHYHPVTVQPNEKHILIMELSEDDI